MSALWHCVRYKWILFLYETSFYSVWLSIIAAFWSSVFLSSMELYNVCTSWFDVTRHDGAFIIWMFNLTFLSFKFVFEQEAIDLIFIFSQAAGEQHEQPVRWPEQQDLGVVDRPRTGSCRSHWASPSGRSRPFDIRLRRTRGPGHNIIFFFNFMRQTYWMFREIVDWKVFRTFLNFVRVSQSFERYFILQTEVYILHIYQTFYNWLLTNLSWTISWKSPSPKSLLRSDHKPTVPQTPRKCDNIRCKYRQSYNKTIDFSMYLCIFTQLLDILHSAGDELKTDELAKRGRVESKLKEQATQEYCTVRPLEIRWPNSSE